MTVSAKRARSDGSKPTDAEGGDANNTQHDGSSDHLPACMTPVCLGSKSDDDAVFVFTSIRWERWHVADLLAATGSGKSTRLLAYKADEMGIKSMRRIN